MPQEVVIVGADGKEHVFPAGFDPQKAASIVRGGKSLGGFASNVAESGANFLGDIYNTVRHPIDTGKNVLKLAKGAVELAIPGEQGDEESARAVGRFYKDRYGGMKNIGNTLYNDPVGAVADLSTVLGGGAGVLKATGAPAKVARAAQVASDVTNPVRAVTAPAKAAFHGAGTLTAHVTTRPGTALQKQAGSHFRIGREIAEKGLYNRAKAETNLDNAIDAAIQKADTSGVGPTPRNAVVDMPKAFDEATKRVGMVDESVDEIANVQSGLARDLPPQISIQDLLKYRKFWDREWNTVAEKWRRETPGGSVPMRGLAFKEAADNARGVLNTIPGMQESNRAVQTAMLAKGAVDTAQSRPHALSRIVATGTGLAMRDPLSSMAIIAMDSPRFGARSAHGSWVLGNAADNPAAVRAALLARMLGQAEQE